MKKIIILTLLCFYIIIPTNAQLNIGIEASPGISGTIARKLDSRVKFGAQMGCYINYSIDKNDFFETGIYISGRGYDLTGFTLPDTEFIQELNMNMNYIEIPFMVGFNYLLSESKDIHAIIKAGIYIGWGINGNGTLTGLNAKNDSFEKELDDAFNSQDFTIENNIYHYEGFKKFDVGGKFGVDLVIKNFSVRLSYIYGFKNMNPTYDKSIKNVEMNLGLGYSFSLLKHKK